MEQLVSQILTASIPIKESVRANEFKNHVNIIKNKIIEMFRYTEIELVPQFLSLFVKEVDEFTKSSDKKKKFAATICLTAIIKLFPFDDFIPQVQPIVERLLRPGYKPLISISAEVLHQIAKIRGRNRDIFIRQLIIDSQKQLIQTEWQDARFAAAVIWEEISDSAPEHIFALGEEFTSTITSSLRLGDNEAAELLIHTIENIIDSECAPNGAKQITEMPHKLLDKVKEHFANARTDISLLPTLRLFHFLLDVKPVISTEECTQILPDILKLLNSKSQVVIEVAISIICKMASVNRVEISTKVITDITDLLFTMAKKTPMPTAVILSEVVLANPTFFRENIKKYTSFIAKFLENNTLIDVPLFAFHIIIALIKIVPPQNQMKLVIELLLTVFTRSMIPLPLQDVVKAFNENHSNWMNNYAIFKYQLMQEIREELTNEIDRTDIVVNSLLALNEIKNVTYNDALEFTSLVVKLKKNKDLEVREMISESVIRLFEDYPEQIPLLTIRKLVKFTLEDTSRRVRLKNLAAFGPSTYMYLSQPDVFPIFANFINDESSEVRISALSVIKNLPMIQKSIMRKAMFTALKQINTNFITVVPEVEQAWQVFPYIIAAMGKMLPLYAESLFKKFYKILNDRFNRVTNKERYLLYMDSAIMLKVDESLILTLTNLHLCCPKIAPVEPIVALFAKILTLTVHPWTKILALESLKDIIASGASLNLDSSLIAALIDIIRNNQSHKLVTKALKVIGAIGSPELPIPQKKVQIVFRNGLSQRSKFAKYFTSTLFKNLIEMFAQINIESSQEAIVRCITCLFVHAPDEIPLFINSFMDMFLSFLKRLTSLRLPVFYRFLSVIIEASGHLIIPYIERVFQAIEDDWHEGFTREASFVLSSLVIATDGRCDSILHLVVSVSFLLAKNNSKDEEIVHDIFGLLRVIIQYNNNFLPAVMSGVFSILANPKSAPTLTEQSLDTIEFVLRFCPCSTHLASIERCLISLVKRGQLRWQERASTLISIAEKVNLEKAPERFDFGSNIPIEPQPIFNASIFIDKMTLPENVDITTWFSNLRIFFITESPNLLIRSMNFLPSLPKFAFTFAFIAVWVLSNEDEQNKLRQKLQNIISTPKLPTLVLKPIIRLAEFSRLCEIDLLSDLLVKHCTYISDFSRALFFVETSQSPKSNSDLVKYNIEADRAAEAMCIAEKHPESIDYKLWMRLGEWERAIEILHKQQPSADNFADRVVALSGLERWNEVEQMTEEFDKLQPTMQSEFARHFWTAKLHCGDQNEALQLAARTCAYTVSDCIERVLLFVRCGLLSEANEALHLAWRYLAAAVSSAESRSKMLFSSFAFAAVELHEIGDVISILTGKKQLKAFEEQWQSRMAALNGRPQLQIAVFRVRQLAGLSQGEIDEFGFHSLSRAVRSGRKGDADRVIDLFFPSDSAERRFAIMIRNNINDISAYEKMLCEGQSEVFSKRLHRRIGKLLLNSETRSEEVIQSAAEHLTAAECANSDIADVLLLLSHITLDEDHALNAASVVGRRIMSKTNDRALNIAQLLAISSAFSGSSLVCNAIYEQLEHSPTEPLRHIQSTLFSLINHPSPFVKKIASSLIHRLVSEYPQSVAFSVISCEEKVFSEFLDQLRHQHPTLSAQLELIRRKLDGMAKTISDIWIEKLNEISNSIHKKDHKTTLELINWLIKDLSSPSFCLYESQFRSNFNYKNQLISLSKQTKFNSKNAALIDKMKNTVIGQRDSMRVIPLSSLDEQLDRKNDWSISIPGRENVKVAKFSSSVLRWKNGFKVAIIGVDGRKYSFHLKHKLAENTRTDDFSGIIFSLNKLYSVSRRVLIRISPLVTLNEILKGYISVYDVIATYRQIRGAEIETDIVETSHKLDAADIKKREKLIKEFSSGESSYDLAKAIIVTSDDARSWIQRSSNFSSSTGTLSALSFILGDVKTAPSDILFEKTTGFTTYSSLNCTGSSHPVPFRLTPMIENAFGTCGVDGPFRTSLISLLNSVKENKLALAVDLQFVLGKEPYKSVELPTQYLQNQNYNTNEDIDLLYGRISKYDVDELIKMAKSVENLAQMPTSWLSWW